MTFTGVAPGQSSLRALEWLARVGASPSLPLQLVMGCSERVARDHVSRLEAAGLVQRTPMRRCGGGRALLLCSITSAQQCPRVVEGGGIDRCKLRPEPLCLVLSGLLGHGGSCSPGLIESSQRIGTRRVLIVDPAAAGLGRSDLMARAVVARKTANAILSRRISERHVR